MKRFLCGVLAALMLVVSLAMLRRAVRKTR